MGVGEYFGSCQNNPHPQPSPHKHHHHHSDRDGQTMVWTIFHFLPIKLKFQWAILSKLNIAICFQLAIFLLNGTMSHGPPLSQSLPPPLQPPPLTISTGCWLTYIYNIHYNRKELHYWLLWKYNFADWLVKHISKHENMKIDHPTHWIFQHDSYF